MLISVGLADSKVVTYYLKLKLNSYSAYDAGTLGVMFEILQKSVGIEVTKGSKVKTGLDVTVWGVVVERAVESWDFIDTLTEKLL